MMKAIIVLTIVVGCASGFFMAPVLPYDSVGALNPSNINHFCTVVKNFNTSVNSYVNVFGGSLPIGYTSSNNWTYYNGLPTEAQALLTKVPVGDGKFTWEILQPADDYPSFWRQILEETGDSFHHIGLTVDEMDSARAGLEALGYPTIQIGQGNWGCYAYIDGRQQFGAVLELLSIGQLNCSKPTYD
eukprot:TRINITY_DN6606_c0_g1_i1.p1 TRINITY_DN6606_c0_g1~~TRINITY_DN6606_c0_g1_i1.p1  ORF type:complete len:187 (+),score=33.55 TRINITY_DN6606_c0_g1_i1:297-857(+)